MNHPEFMTAITNCYGTFNKELDKYIAYQSEMLEKITFKYIKERFQESELESIFAKIIVKVNPKFKTPPPRQTLKNTSRDRLMQILNSWRINSMKSLTDQGTALIIS